MGKVRNLWAIYRYAGFKGIVRKLRYNAKNAYNAFIKMENIPTIEQMQKEIRKFEYLPKFSIIIPVYKPNMKEFDDCLNSIMNQGYENLEVCIVDDGSQDVELITYLQQKISEDFRIKVQINNINQGISVASNDAIALATGEYIGLVDQDDLLAPHALYEYSIALQMKKYDFLYSDEDMISVANERFNPQFKPDWSPHTLLSRMYINHFSVYNAELIRKVGGFRTSFNGSQDYDLVMRASSHFKNVFHSSKILYHWRTSENSIALSINNKAYIYDKATRAIQDFLLQQEVTSTAKSHNDLLMYDLKMRVKSEPLVSIIIAFENEIEFTKKLLLSIVAYGGYKNIEIILVDNKSSIEQKGLYSKMVAEFEKNHFFSIKMITTDFLFNSAKSNNLGVKYSSGEYLLFLNNNIEFTKVESIYQLLSVAQLNQTGAVSMTLLYPDNTIKQAGIVMGTKNSGAGMISDNPGYYGRNISLYNFSVVPSDCLLVSKRCFEEVGGFEEKLLFVYSNIDFCLKLLEKNYFNVNNGSIQARHNCPFRRKNVDLNEKKGIQDYMKTQEKWSQYIIQDPFYNNNLSNHTGELYQIALKKEG